MVSRTALNSLCLRRSEDNLGPFIVSQVSNHSAIRGKAQDYLLLPPPTSTGHEYLVNLVFRT